VRAGTVLVLRGGVYLHGCVGCRTTYGRIMCGGVREAFLKCVVVCARGFTLCMQERAVRTAAYENLCGTHVRVKLVPARILLLCVQEQTVWTATGRGAGVLNKDGRIRMAKARV
jgi:hypothetical protein